MLKDVSLKPSMAILPLVMVSLGVSGCLSASFQRHPKDSQRAIVFAYFEYDAIELSRVREDGAISNGLPLWICSLPTVGGELNSSCNQTGNFWQLRPSVKRFERLNVVPPGGVPTWERIEVGKGVLFYAANVPPGTVSIDSVELAPWSSTSGYRTRTITPTFRLTEMPTVEITGCGVFNFGAYRVSVRDQTRVVKDEFIIRPENDQVTIVLTKLKNPTELELLRRLEREAQDTAWEEVLHQAASRASPRESPSHQ